MNQICSKKQLDFFIKADMMMNTGKFQYSMLEYLYRLFVPDYITNYLICLRKLSYYQSFNHLKAIFYKYKCRKLSIRLGISLHPNVFGYGLLIPHYGTIVVGDNNVIGNFCVLHTSTCISSNGKIIGDNLYLSTGAKMTGVGGVFGNNITIAPNSVVTKPFPDGSSLLVGMPAIIKKKKGPWWRGDRVYEYRVKQIESLKLELFENGVFN